MLIDIFLKKSDMNLHTFFIRIVCLIIFPVTLLIFSENVSADDTGMSDETLVQAVFGISILDENDSLTTGDSGESLTTSVSTFPVLGVMGQAPLVLGESVMAGFEGGADVSWWRDEARVLNIDGTTRLFIKNKMLMMNLLMGGFVSTDPEAGVRFYAGAGGLLSWGNMDVETESDEIFNETESSFGYGGYVRAGVEFQLNNGGLMGLSGRYTSSKIDFESSYGRVDFDGFQIMMTYSAPVGSLGGM